MNWLEQKTLGLFVKTNGILSNYFYGGLGHIFMLHRVLPEKLRNKYTINRDLAITPEYLEQIIVYLKSHDYRFISLDELYSILIENKKLNQRFICFTLDDGYKDNLEYGFPIFEKYQVPFTIYVTNSFPDYYAILWWYLLEEKIEKSKSIKWNTKTYTCNNETEKTSVYQIIRNSIKAIDLSKRDYLVVDFFKKDLDELRGDIKKISLSWTEIKELSNEKLVTIGGHTLNHFSLKNLQIEEVENEVECSKKELEKKIEKEVLHFAYPYGGFDDAYIREYQIARKAGFKTAVINHPGNIFVEHKKSLMTLPRYALGNNTDKQKLLYYLNGIQHFGNNQFIKTIKY